MFQLIVIPANSTANTALTYDSKETFEMAKKNFHEKLKVGGILISQSDDAGQTVEIQADNVSYVLFIDMVKQQEFTSKAKMASSLTSEKPKFVMNS